MDMHNLIEQLVYIAPTVLFVLIILLSFLLGFIRGFRKSLILLINATLALSISLILFFALVSSTKVDKFLLTSINSIMGSKYYLQQKLNVSITCTSLREVILEYIPKNVNFYDGLSLILEENGNYLATLVDMTYRIIFGLVCYILYYIFIFIGYIIYLIFFKEGRYKKKMERALLYGQSPYGYKKKKLKGGCLNLTRGLVKACVDLSFIGMIFYIVAGGVGDREKTEFDTTNEEYNYIVDCYDAIGSYGTKGIYKVLNMAKDKNDVPYYLFAADLVFKGNLYDTNNKVIDNVYLKDELAAYTKFSRNTADLLLKYGDKDIREAILNKSINVWDVLYPIFTNTSFQSEFKEVILEFEGGTYFINLTYSLISSISSHLDDLSFTSGLPDMAKDMLNILFNDNYKCSKILYEASLESSDTLSTLSPSIILNKYDISTMFDLFTSFLSIYDTFSDNIDYKSSTITYIKTNVDKIKELSIFNTSKKSELDGVYKRLVAYFVVYLNSKFELENTLEDSAIYYTGEFSGVSWTTELDNILDIAVDATYIYETITSLSFDSTKNVIDSLYTTVSLNKERFNNIIVHLNSSSIISAALKSKIPAYYINKGLNSLNVEFIMPSGITFETKNNTEGELSVITNTLLTLLSSDEYKEYILKITDETDTLKRLDDISIIVRLLKEDTINGYDPLIYISKSKVINTILSNFLYSFDISNITIYRDDSVVINDENGALLIEEGEFETLLYNFFDFYEFIKPLIDDPSVKNIVSILEDKKINTFLNSSIIRGTLLNTMLDKLKTSEGVVIPSNLDSYEMQKLINIIQDDNINIDLEGLIEGNIDSITNLLDSISKESFDILYDSLIISINITHHIKEAIKDYTYDIVLENAQIYTTDVGDEGYYNGDEIYYLITSFKTLDVKITDVLNDSNNINLLKDNLWNLSYNDMITLWNSNLLSSMISVQIDRALESESLGLSNINSVMHDKLIFNTIDDLWHYTYIEVYQFRESFKEAFGINSLNGIKVSTSDFFNLYSKDSDTEDISKINSLYNSSLSVYVISDRLDDILKNDNIGLKKSEIEQIKNTDEHHSYKIYTKNELQSLIKCLKYDFKIDSEDSLDNLNYNTLISGFSDDNIDNIYSSSICKLILSKNLDKILTSKYIDYSVRENTTYIKQKEENMIYYQIDEIKNILNVNKTFNFFTSDGNFNIPTQDTLNDDLYKDKRDELFASNIILGVMTHYVKSDITKESDKFVDTPLAYVSSDFLVYKREELNAIIDLLDGNSENPLENLSIESSKNAISNSYLLWASISKNFIENNTNLIVVDELITTHITDGDITDSKNKFILKDEILKFLDASSCMEISNINDINDFDSKSSLNKDNLDTILDSLIIRSTLPMYTIISKNNNNYILNQLLSSLKNDEVYNIKNVQVYVLNKDDFKNFLEGIMDICGYGGNGLSFSLPDDYTNLFIYGDYNEISKPLIILISEYLSTRSILINGISVKIEDAFSAYFKEEECYNLYIYTISNKKILTQEGYNYFYNYF